MSADNWAKCPRCAPDDGICGIPAKETLREDYHLGTEQDGMFSVVYKCSCDRCGLKFNFTHRVSVLAPVGRGERRER